MKLIYIFSFIVFSQFAFIHPSFAVCEDWIAPGESRASEILSFSVSTHEPYGDSVMYIDYSFKKGEILQGTFDSGAFRTILKYHPLFDNLDIIEKIEIMTIEGYSFFLNKIRLDSGMFLGHWFIESPEFFYSKEFDRVLIAMDYFENRVVEFDFLNSQIQLSTESEEQLDQKFVSPENSSEIYIDYSISNELKKSSALWDTGASVTTVSVDLVSKFPSHFELVATADLGDGLTAPLYLLKDLCINDFKIPDHHALALDFSESRPDWTFETVVFGLNAIRNFQWSFNLKNKTWSMEAFAKNKGVPPSIPQCQKPPVF